MAALLIKGGSIKDFAVNKDYAFHKSFIKPYREGLNLHAEVALLAGKSKKEVKGSTVYVRGRTTKAHKELTSKPCPSCLAFMIDMGVSKVVYMENELVVEVKL